MRVKAVGNILRALQKLILSAFDRTLVLRNPMSTSSNKQIYLHLVMLAAATMLLGTAWIGDDAFITLRVIDNFLNGFGLRYNVIERVQVFTHPLWLLFLTPFYALTREAMVTTMLVSISVSLGALWLMATRIAKNREYACLLVLVAAISPTISSFSTSGLESPLTFLLLTLFIWQLHRTETTWIPAGIAGLLLVNRLDLIILIGPVLAYLLFRARGRERINIAASAIFPAMAWVIFSVIYYGAPLPNTAYAKLGTGFSAEMLILRGLEYARVFVFTDSLLALIIGKAIFDALRFRVWRSRVWITILPGVGIVLYIAYIVAIGGDFMSGRFFAPPGYLALCLLARATPSPLLLKQAKRIMLVAVGVLGILLAIRITEQPNFVVPENGIADERRYYYSNNGLLPVLNKWINTGSEPIHPWGQHGMRLKAQAIRAGEPIVALRGNAGMPGFYAGPTVHNVDAWALTDAFLARLPAIPQARVGHYERRVPFGYAETTLNSIPTTWDENLSPLLNDVTLATRAPIFDKQRWRAIWRLLSGHYNWVYNRQL